MERLTLVDSSIYIRLIRRFGDPSPELNERYRSLDLATCGVVKAEVLRGMKNPRTRDALARFLDVLIFIPTTNRLWDAVTDLAWTLDRQGVVLPLPDLVIGCCAMQLGADVLTLDGHFGKIPELRLAPVPEAWR